MLRFPSPLPGITLTGKYLTQVLITGVKDKHYSKATRLSTILSTLHLREKYLLGCIRTPQSVLYQINLHLFQEILTLRRGLFYFD